jgi:hypothetical protein
MGMTVAELLFAAALGYGIYKILKPFQEWLEKALTDLSKGKKRSKGVVIDVETENHKRKGT